MSISTKQIETQFYLCENSLFDSIYSAFNIVHCLMDNDVKHDYSLNLPQVSYVRKPIYI